MRWFIIILVFAGLVLAVPHGLRLHGQNPYPIGSDGYDILHDAALVRSGASVDPLAGREISSDLHTYLVAGLLGVMQPFTVALAMPALAGLLAAAVFFALARKVLKERAAVMAGFLFVVSPLFIFSFATFNRWYLTVVLVLFALYFFVEGKMVVCSAVSAVVLLVDPLVFLLLAVTYTLRLPDGWRRHVMVFGAFSIGAAVIYGLFMRPVSLPVFAFSPYLVDFGAPWGVDLALLILTAIGLAFVRKRISVAIIALLAFAFISQTVLMYACLFLPLFAGIAGDYLLHRSWSLPNLKQLTVLVIFCTFLFSFIAYERMMTAAVPQPFFVRAVENIPEGEKSVLAPREYAPYIRYFAGRRVASPEGNDTLEQIYRSRDLKTTEFLLDNGRIDTFFVTREMREGLVWERAGEGLDFLLPHSGRFANVYSYEKEGEAYEVWVYRARPEQG